MGQPISRKRIPGQGSGVRKALKRLYLIETCQISTKKYASKFGAGNRMNRRDIHSI